MRSISVILISLFLAACQATTGKLLSQQEAKGLPPCEPVSITEASVNWAVFGGVIEVKNCPGQGSQYQERYKLANGWGVYQQANNDYTYFYEVNEDSFREALGSNSTFSDSATTIKIHNPSVGHRFAMFAQTRAKGKNIFYFKMNSSPGHGDGTEWGKLSTGLVYYDGHMSSEEFRQHFLERLRVFDTSAAESFIAANRKIVGESHSTTALTSTKSSTTPPLRSSTNAVGLVHCLREADGKLNIVSKTLGGCRRSSRYFGGSFKPISEVEYDRRFEQQASKTDKSFSPSTTTKASQPTKIGKIDKRLRKLKKLVDDGLVTPDEAAAKRKEILNSL